MQNLFQSYFCTIIPYASNQQQIFASTPCWLSVSALVFSLDCKTCLIVGLLIQPFLKLETSELLPSLSSILLMLFASRRKKSPNLCSQSWIENVGCQKLKMTSQRGVFSEQSCWNEWYKHQKMNHSVLSFNKLRKFII